MKQLKISDSILTDEKYKYIFSVEVVNREVLNGLPFREAYQKIGRKIEEGTFVPVEQLNHSHEGSIGNLCNDKIQEKLQKVISKFQFERAEMAIEGLVRED